MQANMEVKQVLTSHSNRLDLIDAKIQMPTSECSEITRICTIVVHQELEKFAQEVRGLIQNQIQTSQDIKRDYTKLYTYLTESYETISLVLGKIDDSRIDVLTDEVSKLQILMDDFRSPSVSESVMENNIKDLRAEFLKLQARLTDFPPLLFDSRPEDRPSSSTTFFTGLDDVSSPSTNSFSQVSLMIPSEQPTSAPLEQSPLDFSKYQDLRNHYTKKKQEAVEKSWSPRRLFGRHKLSEYAEADCTISSKAIRRKRRPRKQDVESSFNALRGIDTATIVGRHVMLDGHEETVNNLYDDCV